MAAGSLSAGERPPYRLAVFVGHHPVEGAQIGVENQRQKVLIARPQGKFQARYFFDGNPFEAPFVVGL